MQIEQEGPSLKSNVEKQLKEQENVILETKQNDLKKKQESDRVFFSSQNYLLMKNLYIIFDGTKHSKISDFKPTRLGLIIKHLPAFTDKFLQQNPLSQFGVGVAYNGECRHLVDFTTSSKKLDQTLGTIKSQNENGFSLLTCLQNIKTAIVQFQNTPLYLTQNILMIISSPYTDDTRDIIGFIQKIKNSGIRVDVISFCGVVNIFKQIATQTGGTYQSPLNEAMFQKQLQQFILPSEMDEKKLSNALVDIGFPQKILARFVTLCMCHLTIVSEYYKCPRCLAKICSVPMRCPLCELWVVLPNQIIQARKTDLGIYQLITQKTITKCYSCGSFQEASQCETCLNCFCFDCDILIHSELKFCPGCV